MSYGEDDAPPPWEGQRGSSRRPNGPGGGRGGRGGRRGAPDLGSYVEVKDRIKAFYAKYPEGRIQSEVITELSVIQEIEHEVRTYQKNGEPVDKHVVYGVGYIAVKAYAYRTPDDPRPATGMSGMFLPGTTPYTLNSELENAETSAWGRALANLDILNDQGIASRDEVRNKRDEDDEAAEAYEAAQVAAPQPVASTGSAREVSPSPESPGEAPEAQDGAPEGSVGGLSMAEFMEALKAQGGAFVHPTIINRIRGNLFPTVDKVNDLDNAQRAQLLDAILEDLRLEAQAAKDRGAPS